MRLLSLVELYPGVRPSIKQIRSLVPLATGIVESSRSSGRLSEQLDAKSVLD
jgi:hypothetical protein